MKTITNSLTIQFVGIQLRNFGRKTSRLPHQEQAQHRACLERLTTGNEGSGAT